MPLRTRASPFNPPLVALLWRDDGASAGSSAADPEGLQLLTAMRAIDRRKRPANAAS